MEIIARSALYVRECKIRRCPFVRPSFVRKIIDFCEGYVGGWTLLYTLGSLNYEFGGFWKKLKQKPSKTTIKLWLRHVRGPVLNPLLGPVWGPFLQHFVAKKIVKQHTISGRQMTLRAMFVELTHVTSAIRCDDFNPDTLSDVRSASRLPCKV